MKFLFTLLLLMLSIVNNASAQTSKLPDGATVTATTPIIMSNFATSAAYIIGIDGRARTCPDNYGLYVRVEVKGSDLSFHYIVPGQILRSNKEHPYIVACFLIK
jgi:hypothetical protein